jgi:DNA-binding MarR family transcriptional regulator
VDQNELPPVVPEVLDAAPEVVIDGWSERLMPPLRDLVRISRRAELHGVVQREAGLNLPAHAVLPFTRIGDFQPIRLSDLADQLDVGRTTLSRQVAVLVERGLVTRLDDTTDGRAAMLELSSLGEAALRRFWQAWSSILDEASEGWTNAERELLVRLLAELTDRLGQLIRKTADHA